MDEENAFVDRAMIDSIVTMTHFRRESRKELQLERQMENKMRAVEEVVMLKSECSKIIDTGRGGETGMHGFLGEVCQCRGVNALLSVNGQEKQYEWTNDNGVVDYYREDVPVQQKASITRGHCGLGAVLEHNAKYPNFVSNGGEYEIPADCYEEYCKSLSIPKEEANKLRKDELRRWVYCQNFNSKVPRESIKPMMFEYSEIQREKVSDTITKIENRVDSIHYDRCNEIENTYRPTAEEGLKVSLAAGGINCIECAVIYIHCTPKSIFRYTASDWKDLGKVVGGSFLYGMAKACKSYLETL